MNHDDDILFYALYRDGMLLDEYNSGASCWDHAGGPAQPRGGSAHVLCQAFGIPGNLAEVERVLGATAADDEDADTGPEFVFEWERHAALLKALDWPDVPYQQGFDYLLTEGATSDWRLIG
jgi:hypothetical protein